MITDYIFWGLLGAVAHIIVMKVWIEKTYVIREFILSIIISIVMWQTNYPNSLVTFGLAFLGIDAIESFLRRITTTAKNQNA